MPAVALVGAYASISAGIAAGAATFLGGLQIAAGVMTGLGAITGNKKLMTIGAVASLGAGLYSAATSTATSAASGIESVGGEGVSMGSAAGNAGSNAAEMGFSDLGGASDIGAVSSAVSGGDVVGSALGPAGDSIYSLTSAPTAPQPGGLVQQALGPSDSAAAVSNAARSGTAGTPGGLVQTNALAETTETGLLAKAGNKLSSFAQLIEKNPNVAKLGLGLVSGATDAYSEQQALRARERLMAEQRARYNASILNQRA